MVRFFSLRPQNWENKVVSDARAKSEIPISGTISVVVKFG